MIAKFEVDDELQAEIEANHGNEMRFEFLYI